MKKSGYLKDSLKTLFRRGDLILLAVFIVVIVLTIVFSQAPTGGIAEIYIDGALKYQLDLSKDTTLSILDGKMTVKVCDGQISVAESDCSEQLCVNSSAISTVGGMIICLPNKVVIKVPSKEVDAIT